jgi:hypothetical protein
MTLQILSELDRLVPPRVRAINPLVKTLRNCTAKLEMVRDSENSCGTRLAAEGGMVIATFGESSATRAEEQRELENISFDAHSSIEIHRA